MGYTPAPTPASQGIDRQSIWQDVDERGGSTGSGALVAGQQGLVNSAQVRQRIVDVVIGDSIGAGGGSTAGATDWATILGQTENRIYNFVDPFFGFVAASNWSALGTNSVAAAGATGGPSALPSNVIVTSGGVSISDISTTLSCATTVSAAPYNNILAAQATITNIVPGMAINGTGLSGNGIPGNTYVQNVNGSTTVTVTNCTVTTANPYVTSTSSLASVVGGMAVTGTGIPGTTTAPQVFVNAAPIGNQITLQGNVAGITGGTVTLTFTPTITMNQQAVAAGTNTLTFVRGFRRCKVYYQQVANGDGIAFSVTGGSAPTSGTLDTNGSAIQVWDSGDLLSQVGTGITATWEAHASGSGGAGSYIIGVEYIQNNGLQGVVTHNIAQAGTTSGQWATRVANTEAYLTFLANQGTPARRCYVFLGINDLQIQFGFTPANLNTNLTNIIVGLQAASPLTEIVLVVEQFGDIIQYIGQCSNSSTPVASGTVTVATVQASGGVVDTPEVGALIFAPGQAATVIATVASIVNGTSFTCTLTGSGTFPATSNQLCIASNLRGGAANYALNWIPVIEQLAITYGCTLINLYERFGDISAVTSLQSCVTTAGSTTVTLPASVLPQGVTVGQYVFGTTITPGTSVTVVGSTTITLSQPAYAAGTETLSFTNDKYGVSQQLLTGGPHLGDYNISFSGRDGQRAMAQCFRDKLAYANQTQSPTTLVTSTPSDGLLFQTISNGLIQLSGYQDANDSAFVWQIGGKAGAAIAPGFYTGLGGVTAFDTSMSRAAASAAGFGEWVMKNSLAINGPSGTGVGAMRFVGGTTGAAPITSSYARGDTAVANTGQLYICTTAGVPPTGIFQKANQAGLTTNNPGASPTVNTDTTDIRIFTAIANNLNLSTNTTGTPQPGQRLVISLTDNGTARTLTWTGGTIGYVASESMALPTTTAGDSTALILEFIYNGTNFQIYAGGEPTTQPVFNASLGLANSAAGTQVSTTRDSIVGFRIGTAGTAFTVNIGPASTPTNLVLPSVTPISTIDYMFPVPKGWFIAAAGTSTTIASSWSLTV